MNQGHPRSKVTVPIDSPWVVSYTASIEPSSYLSPFSAQTTLHDEL